VAEPIAERPAGKAEPAKPEPTLKLEPIPADATATEQIEPVETAGTPPIAPTGTKKKRRWIGWLVASVALVALLVVGFLVAENFAREFATGYVRDRVVAALGIDPTTPVDVEIGGGSVILQALAGSVDEVTVDIDELTFGDVTGSARLVATGVPLDSSRPVGTLGITVTVTEENVRTLATYLSGLELSTIEVGDGLISIGTEFSVFGFITMPATVGLEPSATGTGIVFSPKTITLGDQEISVAELLDNPLLGGLAGQFLASREFCVAQYLPKSLTVTDATVVGSSIVVTITGDGAALGAATTSAGGTCPATGN
jgi:hypothetical protein